MSRSCSIHPLLAKQRHCLVDHARDDRVVYKDRRNQRSKESRLQGSPCEKQRNDDEGGDYVRIPISEGVEITINTRPRVRKDSNTNKAARSW
ncbi:hypothetical protein F2Q69_00052806 [Brassica cretica]|uniref:Uncharacterized protein n=1 Tax=Brassica cretica TaxID=69181 RepID=A0A8S9N017_BRACR|nr:hypothetical protein F2Q69_00052806 [Brassica cretica]